MQKWIDTCGGSRRCSKELSTKGFPGNSGSLWSLVLAGGHGERLRAHSPDNGSVPIDQNNIVRLWVSNR
jgi:hypothetical protein